MKYEMIKLKRRVAFVLAATILAGGVSLSLNSRAHAARTAGLGAPMIPSPTQPGSNGKIAFTSTRDGNAEIYLMNPDGTGQVNLTKNPAHDATPAWSPDGSRIAFTSDRSGIVNIYVMNADGSNVTKVTANDGEFDNRVFDPAWSPDGTKLVYVGSFMGEISTLLIVNADGTGGERVFEPTSTEVADPEWSPDGTRIAFTGREACRNCYPDPASIFFSLYVVNANGSGKTIMGDYPKSFASFFPRTQGSGPTWSPDGSLIAYAYDNGPSPAQQPRRVADILTVKPGGGGSKFLTETSAEETFPSWSPDGKQLAFTSNRDGHREIYVMNADGAGPVRITSTAGENFDPNWQAQGSAGAPAPIAPTIQFRSSTFRVRERLYTDRTQDPLTVTRLGDLSQAASVDFTTTSSCLDALSAMCIPTASERSDYTTTSGTLRFAPGEASKSIIVPIIDDAFVESSESFNVALSNPVGATLGGQQTTAVTILDNDSSPNSPNPIGGTAFFVRQHYLDFLNREPEPQGFADWQNILNNCPAGSTACDHIEVSSAFFRSTEFEERGYLVYRFYAAALGRVPHYAEFMPDLAKVSGFQTAAEQELSKQAFISNFMGRAEFKALYDGHQDPRGYVDAILATAGVSVSNKQQLVTDLQQNAKTRAEVLRAVVESPEVHSKFYNEAFVVMQYFGYLRRDADILYLEWVKTMNAGGDYRVMINGFLNSQEYRSRFGNP